MIRHKWHRDFCITCKIVRTKNWDHLTGRWVIEYFDPAGKTLGKHRPECTEVKGSVLTLLPED